MDQDNHNCNSPRICLLINSFYPRMGGGESHALSLCREWAKRGISVIVLTRRITRDLKKNEFLDGFKIRRLAPSGCSRFGKYLMILPAFVELIRQRNNFDVLYVCGLRVAGIPAMLASRVLRKPCVLRAESIGELSGDFIWNSPDQKIKATPFKPLIKACLSLRNHLLLGASAFVSIASPIAVEFEMEGVFRSRNRIIHNGIDTKRFAPSSAGHRKSLRIQLGLPENSYIFAYSGKLNKGKGLELLLRVWDGLCPEFPEGHLLLIGSGGQQYLSCESELRDFVRLHGLERRVTFTGFRENVSEYLQSADAFVFPSENEAFGLALVEAMACELPCLASRTGGIVDIIQEGKTGRLLEFKNEEDWFRGMRELLTDPARGVALGKQGRASVLEQFQIARIAEEHLELFRSLSSPSSATSRPAQGGDPGQPAFKS